MLYATTGCSNCNTAGSKGRMGVHELLPGTDEVTRAVQRRAPIDELRNLAMQQGMRTLLQDALEKAMHGITDVKQARSVAVKKPRAPASPRAGWAGPPPRAPKRAPARPPRLHPSPDN